MPNVLKEMPKVKRAGRKPKYDFDSLFSHGDKPVELVEGEDFDCTVTTMRHNLYRHADQRNLEIKTVTLEDGKIAFQIKGEKTPKTKATTKKSTKKSTAKK